MKQIYDATPGNSTKFGKKVLEKKPIATSRERCTRSKPRGWITIFFKNYEEERFRF
jgi:hypothetical protein